MRLIDKHALDLSLILLSWMVTISLGAMVWARWQDPATDTYTRVALTVLWGMVLTMCLIASGTLVYKIRLESKRSTN